MRTHRFIAAMAIAALGVALSASPAIAFDQHFRVHVRNSFHQHHHVLHFTGRLFNPRPGRHHERVGRSHGRCGELRHRLRCHFVFRLNGRIGGRGHIKARGGLSHRDNKVHVVGGSGGFNGVAGKLFVHPNHLHFDLTR